MSFDDAGVDGVWMKCRACGQVWNLRSEVEALSTRCSCGARGAWDHTHCPEGEA